MAYGLKYYSEFTSEMGVNYKVQIFQKDYASATTELVMGGEPVVINYNGDEAKFSTIRGSECAVTFFAKFDYQFTEIVKADKNDFQIRILKNNNLYWQGYVIQDNYNEPFMPLPYLVTIRATDGLGDLKFYDYKDLSSNLFLNKQSQIEVILACLSNLKNGIQVSVANDLYELRIDKNDASNEALNRIFINPFVYLKDGEKVANCAEVLTSILEIYNCYIYYKEGVYYIDRVNYKLNNVITRRVYNIDFNAPSSLVNYVTSSNILGSINSSGSLRLVNADANFTYQTPYKYLNIENDNSVPDSLILNNQFLNWNSSNTVPDYWSNNGLNYLKTGNTKSNSILKVTSIVDNDASITATSSNLSLPNNNFTNIMYQGDSFKVKLAYYGNIRLAIKLSNGTTNNWLYKNADTYTWSSTFRFINIQLPDGNYSENRPNRWDWVNDFWHTLEFDTVGVTNLSFNKMDVYILPSYNNPNGWMGTGSYIRELIVDMSTNNTNNYQGEIYKLSTAKNYTETYEDLNPIFGEFANIGNTNQLLINSSSGYTYTQNWYRDGKTESKALLQLAGTSILNQYREPFKNFSGAIRGEFDFGKVYSISHLEGRFMPYKATLNLKNDVVNVEMFELLPESDLNESTHTFVKKANLGSSTYNSLKITDVETNRPKPNRSYY
ncbi:hypothetical protein [Pedobacter sp.]|uniref:hypothetical protein n=1 Tax=Pedobacter sp. TaxID=1411316 RepID=UPI003BAD24A0